MRYMLNNRENLIRTVKINKAFINDDSVETRENL